MADLGQPEGGFHNVQEPGYPLHPRKLRPGTKATHHTRWATTIRRLLPLAAAIAITLAILASFLTAGVRASEVGPVQLETPTP